MKLGVIDLGTNTFHLLIVEVNEDNAFEELYRERMYVQLADEGINTIGPKSYRRAVDAMVHYAAMLARYEVANVKAFGTAALRRANNGREFIHEIQRKTDLHIELITGDREAELICQGVRRAVPMAEQVDLIMDIGGGSVEFILANKDEVYWAQSFPIGVAVLFNDFHRNDPITEKEKTNLYIHLEETLKPLLEAVEMFPAVRLVGASGTFDVLRDLLADEQLGQHYTTFPALRVQRIYDAIIPSTFAERLAMSGVPDTRAKLITVAMILLDFVISRVGVETIVVSEFAMKEGILSEMLDIGVVG